MLSITRFILVGDWEKNHPCNPEVMAIQHIPPPAPFGCLCPGAHVPMFLCASCACPGGLPSEGLRADRAPGLSVGSAQAHGTGLQGFARRPLQRAVLRYAW